LNFRKVGHGSNFPGAEKTPEKFSAQVGDVGRRLGAQKLGCNLTVVPPGKRAWPFHNHRVNEEMFVVLEGEGEADRCGDVSDQEGRCHCASTRRPRHRAPDRQRVAGRVEISRHQHDADAGDLRLPGF
jgi:hypothetical protein